MMPVPASSRARAKTTTRPSRGATSRILIVEDDQRLAELTADYLQANGFEVAVEGDGARAARRIIDSQPDLVILDLMLPGEDGLSICRRCAPVRRPDPDAHRAHRRTDQVQGLDLGADDYVCKPVRPRLLLARIQALLRRSEAPEQAQAWPSARWWSTTPARSLAGRQLIELTSAEFDLLWLLASNAGRILSREEIFTALRGIGYDGQDRSIDVRISRIRPKIGDDPITRADQDPAQQGLPVRRRGAMNSIFLRIYGGMLRGAGSGGGARRAGLHLLNEVRASSTASAWPTAPSA
jgi:two-component system response regulator RstA